MYFLHVDIDECLNETCADENAHCVNTVGSFSCQCNPGFTGDGQNCSGKHTYCSLVLWFYALFFCWYMYIDIDECMNGNYTCRQNEICINTLGSYDCQCALGYTLDGDANCTGMQC